jgi:hypothetical protein
MRFLMRIVIPTAAENSVAADPGFEGRLVSLYRAVGGLEAYSRDEKGRRVDYVLVDIADLAQITARAKRIFDVIQVKSEFLPEKPAEPLFGA